MLCAVDTYKQVYHQQIAQFLHIKSTPTPAQSDHLIDTQRDNI